MPFNKTISNTNELFSLLTVRVYTSTTYTVHVLTKQLRINKKTIGNGTIASGLPNLVTDLLGIGHVTVRGIKKNRIRVKWDISPHLRQS